MKKSYVAPVVNMTFMTLECHLLAPTTWSVDGGSKIPIVDADDGDDEPTGARRFYFSDDFSGDGAW
ncbi:MAG: hypothetical protein SOY99_05505 [Alloprevotella sp.]|nr:hypothetical protein [Alloprevotella sp.]